MLYAYRIILPRHSKLLLHSHRVHLIIISTLFTFSQSTIDFENIITFLWILLLPAQKCARLAMIICNLIKRWLTNDNQNSISLRVVHCRLPGWPQLHFLSAVVILENHSFSLCLITAIICEIFFSSKLQLSSRHWNSFCSEPRVRVSVYKSRICSVSKKLHFCSAWSGTEVWWAR